MMNRIVTRGGTRPALSQSARRAARNAAANTRQDAICAALREVTQIIGAVATVTCTSSVPRRCARRVSGLARRSSASRRTWRLRRLAIAWGVHSTVSPDVQSVDEMVEAATRAALVEGYAAPGDQITIAAGMPFGQGGTTNLLRVAEVGGGAVAGVGSARETATV
ncbi:pyruvate kinase alpha/beta domain-containing protein [Cupriavidus basilensis]